MKEKVIIAKEHDDNKVISKAIFIHDLHVKERKNQLKGHHDPSIDMDFIPGKAWAEIRIFTFYNN